MFGIFGQKEKQDLVLVFDVRSSSVGASLFKAQKSGVPKILMSVREPVLQSETVNVDKFLFSTIKALDVVAGQAFKAGFGVPKNIYCVLASPWYISETRIITLKKDKPFLFTLAMADELIKKETETFKAEHLEKYVKAKQEIRVVELKTIKTILNGYETKNPINQSVQDVEMTLFLSMTPEQVLTSFEEVINKYFHHKVIKFSSFTMASFAVMHNLFSDQPNFLLIDIGGEVTDISMIKRNVFTESISFPLGRHFIVRGICEAVSCTPAEAESYIALINAGHADEATLKKLGTIVDQLKTEWLKSFQESLANLSHDISVPYTIYLSADADFTTFFGKIIEAEQFNQYTLTESKFNIIFMDAETLHGSVEFEKDSARDPFVMIDAAYVNHFLIYGDTPGKV